jgi:hypothetical protein
MEAFCDKDSPEFTARLNDAIKTGNRQLLEEINWPYVFPDKGLRSTHFDIAENPSKKGRGPKIFISVANPQDFVDDSVKEALKEDAEMFSNDFSNQAKVILEKLETTRSLSEEDANLLVEDWLNKFSKRQLPIKISTFDAISKGKMRAEITNPNPSILAIGLGFSGERNHNTPEVDSSEIVGLPRKLEEIGVPPGTPPVQFCGPVVQTSSKGVKQMMQYIDDADLDAVQREIMNSIINDESSIYEYKFLALKQAGLIKEKEVSHEYVEYIVRAPLAKVIDFQSGEEKEIFVWEREGKYYSAMEGDQDYRGLQEGRYQDGFQSYQKEVKLLEHVLDDNSQPVLASGFRALNATNIFLGTVDEGKVPASQFSSRVPASSKAADPFEATHFASGAAASASDQSPSYTS